MSAPARLTPQWVGGASALRSTLHQSLLQNPRPLLTPAFCFASFHLNAVHYRCVLSFATGYPATPFL